MSSPAICAAPRVTSTSPIKSPSARVTEPFGIMRESGFARAVISPVLYTASAAIPKITTNPPTVRQDISALFILSERAEDMRIRGSVIAVPPRLFLARYKNPFARAAVKCITSRIYPAFAFWNIPAATVPTIKSGPDVDVNAVMLGRERGFNVVYGNTKNEAVLRDFGVAPRRTRAVVIALDNVATARDTILTVRQIAPRAKIFARARNLADTQELLKLGVTQALPETIESSFLLGTGVLEHLGVSAGKIDNLLTYLRSDNYSGVEQTIADRG